MRRSLFESHSAQPYQPPRLQPNIFAKLAQLSFRYAGLVVAMWTLLAALIFIGGFYMHKITPQQPMDFAASSEAVKNLASLNRNFPNLNSMIALNISNEDPERLKLDRASLITAIEAKRDIFDLVFAPGTGNYYDTHGILYHSLDDVKARVAYAVSLRPLFSAVAAAPTTESLATLVNQVSASIELGRDPQGLDALFSEAAKSLKALMEGQDRQVDWTVVAGLNVDLQPKSSLVFVLPNPNANGTAITTIEALLKSLPTAEGTTTIVDAVPLAHPESAPQKSPQLLAGFIMAGIFMVFALAALIGDFSLSAMIMAPALGAVAMLQGAILYVLPHHVNALWPLPIAIFIIVLQLATRHAFAALETLARGHNNESAVMLAAQKQGGGLRWLGVIMVAVWASWLTIGNRDFGIVAAMMLVSIVIGTLASLMLIPALVRLLPAPSWRAGEWLLVMYEGLFSNNLWPLLRNALTFAVLVAAGAGFWFVPKILDRTPDTLISDAAVNILAPSARDADAMVKKMKTIPQAQSVRWLGAFLPQQVDEKLSALQGLKDNFTPIAPVSPQDNETLRQQIEQLLERLQNIADSQATRPELRSAAQEFRRSLELLAASTNNAEVRALENRIFGSFNVLTNRAEALVALDKPSLNSLDPRLKALFLSPDNQFRLEVSPVPGQSNLELAQILYANNLPVAHPGLVLEQGRANLKRSTIMIFAAAVAIGLVVLMLAIGEIASFIAASATLIVCLGLASAAVTVFNIEVTAANAMIGIVMLAFAFALVALAFLKRQVTTANLPNGQHALEAWLPTALLTTLLVPTIFLQIQSHSQHLTLLTSGLAAVTTIVAFLLRPLTQLLRGEK
jgi:uncharacterized protein